MAYRVEYGIPKTHLGVFLRDKKNEYGERDEGGINYTGKPLVAAVLCAIKYRNTFLVVDRANANRSRPGWHGFPSGYLDNPDWSVAEHAHEEIRTETGLIIPPSDFEEHDGFLLRSTEQPRGRLVVVFAAHAVLTELPELRLNPKELEVGSARWEHESEFPSPGMFADTLHVADVVHGRVRPGQPSANSRRD